MLPTLSLAFNLTDKLISLSTNCIEIVSACQISERIKKIADGCFKVGTSSYLCSFGILELYHNRSHRKKEGSEKEEVTLNKVVTASTVYFNLHGGLLVGCGLFSLVDALHEFGVLNLGSIGNALGSATNVMFLCANIIALEENFRLINELKETDWTKTNIAKDELCWMKRSAFLGFVSNLGYIITTASLLFSGTTALTILIALFSSFSGGIKIIYDLSLWAKAQHLF